MKLNQFSLYLTLISLAIVLFLGCSEHQQREYDAAGVEKNMPGFVFVERHELYTVVAHKDTRVMYLFTSAKWSSNFFSSAVMLANADGTPLLYDWGRK